MTGRMQSSREINRLRAISIFLIAASIVLFVFSALYGGVEVYLFLIIPVIKMTGIFGPLGILCLISGIIVYLISKFKEGPARPISSREKEKGNGEVSTDWSGIIFIGPIPIVIGNERTRGRFPRWRYLFLIGMVATVIVYLFIAIMLTFFVRG